jgi:hypothetical protein
MQFNILSFKPPANTITVIPYSEKVKDIHPDIVFKDECSKLWEQNAGTLAEYNYLYTSFRRVVYKMKKK